MKRRRIRASLCLAVFLVASPALAGPSDADRMTARELATEAGHAFQNKDYVTAADRFARADALVAAPTLKLGLARAEAALGKLVAANELLNRILREGVPPGSPAVWSHALDDARQEVANLAPRIPWLTINVKGGPDVRVEIDGTSVPSAALGVKRAVDPGPHKIVATAGGGLRAEVQVTVTEGKTESVTLEPKPSAARPSPEPRPPPPVPPPPVPVRAAPPPVASPLSPPPSSSSPRRTAGFVTIGVGAAGLVVGGVASGLFLSNESTLSSKCGGVHCPTSLSSTVSAYHTEGAVATAGIIAGGVLAVTGIVLVVTAPRAASPRVGLSMTPLPGGGALGATGSF